MKIVHAADLHIGSKLSFLDRVKASVKNREISNAFHSMVQQAKQEGVSVILLCGDVFDSIQPVKADKRFFYEVVSDYPEITFYYLKGNHDLKTSHQEDLPNLMLFEEGKWTTYDLGDVTISGIEAPSGAFSSDSPLAVNIPALPEDKYNILMLHGDGFVPSFFAGKNVDYLALGHIHKRDGGPIDSRGRWAYSGCFAGRGFDECGEKGYLLLDSVTKESKFICSKVEKVYEIEIDISGTDGDVAAKRKVCKALESIPSNAIVEAVIVGAVNFDTSNLKTYLELDVKSFLFFKVKVKVKRIYSAEEYRNDPSLIGEFVRQVLSDESLDDEMKEEIVTMGLQALKEEEIV